VNRYLFKAGAVAGVASLAMLAAGPAMAADPVSQATAQSVELSLAGNGVVTQLVTATNDGKKETENNSSTIPDLASLLPNNNLAFVGVAPQEAHATVKGQDGVSYACAGVAGTGGGLVQVGDSACKIGEGNNAATLDLANVDLGGQILGLTGVINDALNNLGPLSDLLTGPTGLLTLLGKNLSDLVSTLTTSLKLPVDLTLSLSAIEGVCTANPQKAEGAGTLADAKLDLNLAGNKLNLVTLPANAPANTKLTDLTTVTTVITNALKSELENILGGQLGALGVLPTQIQNALLTPLTKALKPLTDAIEQYLADVTLNEQTLSDGGKKIDVSAIDLKVLPVLSQFAGGSLISGKIGHVTCGPNAKVAAPPSESPTPTPTATPTTPGHHVPTNVDSGLAGDSSHANEILAAVAALLALAGVGGTAAYRRYGMPRG